jgi:hypothetical protein
MGGQHRTAAKCSDRSTLDHQMASAQIFRRTSIHYSSVKAVRTLLRLHEQSTQLHAGYLYNGGSFK